MSATCPSMIGSRAVRRACASVCSSSSDAHDSSFGAISVGGMIPLSRRPKIGERKRAAGIVAREMAPTRSTSRCPTARSANTRGVSRRRRSRRPSASASRRTRSPPRSTANGSTSTARSTTTPPSRSSPPTTPDGREVLRHSTAHVMAQAVTDLFPGARVRHRARHRRRLLLRLRASRRPALHRGRPRPHRSPHARDRRRRRAVRPRRGRPRRGPARSSPTSRTRSRSSNGSSPMTRRRSGRVCHLRLPQPARRRRRVRRPVPRTARAEHVAARRVQAHAGRRRVLAGRREAPDAPTHLRHGVGVPSRARRAPAPARGGGAARPSPSRARARPLLLPARDRVGVGGVPPQGRRQFGSVMEDYSRAASRARRGTSS